MMPTRLKPRIPSKPAAEEKLIEPTGNVTLDAVTDVVNKTFSAFKTAPPKEQGTLGEISHAMNACLGVVTAPFEMLDHGFAAATASIAKLFPAIPAATLMVPKMGTGHAHPIPALPPRPPVSPVTGGPIMGAGCVSVLIGGVPAARAADVGVGIGCLGITPIFEVYTGSSNTFIGGARAARMGDITRQCNPASAMKAFGKAMGALGVAAGGMAAAASAAGGDGQKASIQAAQAAADAAALAMASLLGKDPGGPPGMGGVALGHPTVRIGGFPMPDTLEVLGGLVKSALKLARSVAKVGRKFARIGKQRSLDPSEPVSVVTGAVYNDFEDVVLPGDVPFFWARHYRSEWADTDGPLGPGFRHFYQKTLELRRGAGLFVDYDGVEVTFPGSNGGAAAVAFGYRLERIGAHRFEVRTPGGGAYVFGRTSASDEVLRLVALAHPRTRRVQLAYNGQGDLIGLRQAGRATWTETTLDRDAQGRIVRISRCERGRAPVVVVRYRYDADGCLAEFGDAQRVFGSYRFRERRMVRAQDGSGYGFDYSYDARGRCRSARGDDGLWGARFEYEIGRTRVTEEDGGEWLYVYNDDGIITKIVDPTGGVAQYRTGDDGRITHEIDAAGRVTQWLYDAYGRNYARLDPWRKTIAPLDEDRDPPDSRAHKVAEDAVSQHFGGCTPSLRRLPVPAGAGDLFDVFPSSAEAEQFDERGRLVQRRDRMGRLERFGWDPRGDLAVHVDPDGCQHRWVYGSWNLPKREIDPLGGVTRIEHGHREQITRIEDPSGHAVCYRYDLAGRVVAIESGGEVEETYAYDERGLLIQKRDAAGEVLVDYEYEDIGLVKVRRLASGETHRLAYDAWGNYAEASVDDVDVTLEHDASGAVLRDERGGRGVRVGVDGARRSMAHLERFVVAYGVDTSGARTIVTPGGEVHRVHADTEGRVLVEHAGGGSRLMRYDPLGRCTASYVYRAACPDEPLRWARYRYSPGGALGRVEDSALGSIAYSYDACQRVVGESRVDRPPVAIHYDVAGNITSNSHNVWLSYDARHRLVASPTERFTYDRRNRLAERRDADGLVTRYHYDALDRLVRIEGDGRPPWTAGYDALGRRTYKQYGDARTEYYWHGDRVAAAVSPCNALRIYVYAEDGALVPLLFVDYDDVDADPTEGRIYQVLCNQVGLPVVVLDGAGEVAWEASDVGAYGALEVRPGNRVAYDLRFPGHVHDPETGLHYNRFRYYSPELGRYLQSDPAGQLGGLNVYAYPANPLVHVDVLGLVHTRGPGGNPNTGDAGGPTTKQPGRFRRAMSAIAGVFKRKKKEPDAPPRPDWRKHVDEAGNFDIREVDGLLRQMKRENPLLGELGAKERDPGLNEAGARAAIADAKAKLAEKGIGLKIVGEDVTLDQVPEHVRPERGNLGRFDDATETIYLDSSAFNDPKQAVKEVRHEGGAVALAREFGGKDKIPKTGPGWWLTHVLDDSTK